MQFCVAEIEAQALLFSKFSKGGTFEFCRLGLQRVQGLAKFFRGGVHGQIFGGERAAWNSWNVHASWHSVAYVRIDFSAHDEANKPGGFHGEAFVAVVDPRGEMIENLARGPIATAAEPA